MNPLPNHWNFYYRQKADKYTSRNVIESQRALTAWLNAWYRMRDIHRGELNAV